MNLREAVDGDLPAISAIYGHHVERGLGTFEEVAPDAAEMGQRVAAVQARGLPWLVVEAEGAVVGFGYVGPFRLRTAYRYAVEDSVYVAPAWVGRGVGRTLLEALIERSRARGLRQILALIGDSGNAASIGLHATCGFESTGLLPAAGFKHGRWVDVVIMRLSLAGDEAPPIGDGWAEVPG
ncbi:GCN5 family acetyltransferase [Chondromyces crocatus]|uniref:GCN5 family acetyltransferase n=1 Tax=Chondromyces crocatus TaxID=52 RepID=A0A0K1EJI2_CHOCO|nr:GNAT family N-acetyltransferase [Chondromyces crocatus]AKT41020.1 GCN5 family acetyltransferase [Chondromyces crocatus]